MKAKLPEALKNLADRLAELPSIGPRQAIRLAFFLISKGENYIGGLANELRELTDVKTCERCFFVHQNKDNLCDICRDPNRKQDLIMVVEKETDLLSLENAGRFNGRYLVIGHIPKTGLLDDAQKLRLKNLEGFIKKLPGGTAEEIVLAFNPTSVGDFHASFIAKELQPYAKKISRLGRGLPTGGEIEFADDETLGSALDKRG